MESLPWSILADSERTGRQMTVLGESEASLGASGFDCFPRERFRTAADYIKNNYTEDLTLDSIAAVVQMSKSHFCREFKKVYGVTPIAYLVEYRISVSKILLANTENSVDKISELSGFGSTSYFCSVFKRIVGVTPRRYRKMSIMRYLNK